MRFCQVFLFAPHHAKAQSPQNNNSSIANSIMSLLSASRSASRYLLAKPGACSVFFQRSMSLDGLKGFPDAESAREVWRE